jgi:hypothetical protein
MFVSVDGERSPATPLAPIGETAASCVSKKASDGKSALTDTIDGSSKPVVGRGDHDSQCHPTISVRDNALAKAT